MQNVEEVIRISPAETPGEASYFYARQQIRRKTVGVIVALARKTRVERKKDNEKRRFNSKRADTGTGGLCHGGIWERAEPAESRERLV